MQDPHDEARPPGVRPAAAAPAAPAAPAPPATVAELEAGLRQLHRMEMQTKLELERVEALVEAAVRVLHRADLVDEQVIRAEAEDQRMRVHDQRLSEERVLLGPGVDKYAVPTSPVDCASLVPICKSRCCRLTVALDFQDLDDGLRWEYARPYQLKRRRDDSYCIYSEPSTRACGVYDVRPTICRTYDCREDKRIWEDFDARKPAPWPDEVAPTPLVQIRLPRTPPR